MTTIATGHLGEQQKLPVLLTGSYRRGDNSLGYVCMVNGERIRWKTRKAMYTMGFTDADLDAAELEVIV